MRLARLTSVTASGAFGAPVLSASREGTLFIKISRRSRGSTPEPDLDATKVVVAVIVIAIVIALLT